MKWLKTVKFRDLLSEYNNDADEIEEIKRIKPIWIERFNSIECLESFVESLKKVKTLNQFNNWLNKVYDFCDDNRIWVDF